MSTAAQRARGRANYKRWYAKRERKEYFYQKRLHTKVETLAQYGPHGELKCSWPSCSVYDVDMLSLDHIENNGAEERKRTGILGGYNLYVRLKAKDFPPGFQTLCCNHQMKKAILLLREKKGRA